jgi:sirohydrochlorin cobaltochelatase
MPNHDSWPTLFPQSQLFAFGEVLVRRLDAGRFLLLHRDDADVSSGLEQFRDAEAALEIARYDDAGEYRPLKTAPNLRRGWTLEVANEQELIRALEDFYPGRLAVLAAHRANRLSTTALRDTLGRQTGMYRIAANISDAQLDCLVADFCRSDSGCLRTILWRRDSAEGIPSTKLPPEKFDPTYDQALTGGAEAVAGDVVPLLCQEACNLLVNQCRKVVKGERN